MHNTKAWLLALALSCVNISAVAGTGFDNRFRIQSGDLNADGRTDLFVKWTPKIVMISLEDISIPIPTSKRDVADFVLQQSSSGTFTIVGSLTATQRSAVSGWPQVSATVTLTPSDFNFDGRLDLAVRNLSAIIAGADNQIVFASTTAGAAPAAVRALNAPMRSFYRELGDWMQAPEITEIINIYQWVYAGSSQWLDPWIFCAGFVECNYFVDDANDPSGTWPGDDVYSPNVYHYWGLHVQSFAQTYRDYEFENETAFDFADILYSQQPTADIPLPSTAADRLQWIWDQIWGLPEIVRTGQIPPEGIEPQVRANWRWGSIMWQMGKVWVEVCIKDEGDSAGICWNQMLNPGHPPISLCETQGPFESGGPTFDYAITVQQRALSQSNQRRPFWASRYEGCDPFAPSALGVIDKRGLGLVTLKWLESIARHKGIQYNEEQLGREIMHEHVSTTDGDNWGIPALLSLRQITDYHQEVFSAHGFPDYTFGGAPLGDDTTGGQMAQDFLGASMWCPNCDKVP